jgi:HPr kinase/phosphorylase
MAGCTVRDSSSACRSSRDGQPTHDREPMSEHLLIHATAVAIDGRAVLLRGASGSGKSDLALRLIDAGARLVADDQSDLRRQGAVLIVRAPATIAGLIELRGIGIMRLDALSEAPVALIADLVPADDVERLPARRSEAILGLAIPRIVMAPFEASAAAKLRLALRAFTEPGLAAMIGA